MAEDCVLNKPCNEIKALVVDDDEHLLDAVAFELEILGCKTITACNGKDALKKFKANLPDVVISDIRMPVCDGNEFLKELRTISVSGPPFFFMTGFSDLHLYDIYDRGADALVCKPLEANEVKRILVNSLRPAADRWRDAPKTSETKAHISTHLSNFDQRTDFQLGRAGFFVAYALANELESLHKDSSVAFKFTTDNESLKSISGSGKVVWGRSGDETDAAESLLSGCGIIIETLDKDCCDAVIDYLTQNPCVMTIPKGSF